MGLDVRLSRETGVVIELMWKGSLCCSSVSLALVFPLLVSLLLILCAKWLCSFFIYCSNCSTVRTYSRTVYTWYICYVQRRVDDAWSRAGDTFRH
jgi:hypothetical protein